MSVLTMDMSSYEVRQDDSSAAKYDDEVLCSGWVPTLALQQSLPLDWENKSSIPQQLVDADAETFLNKMYAYQR